MLNVYRILVRLKNRLFCILIRGSFRKFGRKSLIQLPATVWGESGISIGDGVHIGAGSWVLCLAAEPNTGEPTISIGDGCSFAGGITITAVSRVFIGRNVLIGRNAHISDHAHEFGSNDKPIIQQGVSDVRPVFIGEGAWLGQGVVVCPGVTIGGNSVIGANSVVKSDIPDRCVAVGAPARVIRRLHPS